MSELAQTPRPPYFAVIFSSVRTDVDEGYEKTAARMVELVKQQPGFLGYESSRGTDGLGTTVSYWRSLDDVARWKNVAEHLLAQKFGREKWYRSYRLRVARVEDDWSFETRS
jgi:heme-degrading monooxygenase HmoA